MLTNDIKVKSDCLDDQLKVCGLPYINPDNLDETKKNKKEDEPFSEKASSRENCADSNYENKKCLEEIHTNVNVEEITECALSCDQINSLSNKTIAEKSTNEIQVKRCQACIRYFVKGCNFC